MSTLIFDPSDTGTAPTIILTSYDGTASTIGPITSTPRIIEVLIVNTGSTINFLLPSKARPQREPQPAPFGWRDPVAFIETTRRRPLVIFACSHRAARRDIRRAHRSRWLSELRS